MVKKKKVLKFGEWIKRCPRMIQDCPEGCFQMEKYEEYLGRKGRLDFLEQGIKPE